MVIAKSVKPTIKKAGNLAHGWQLYLAAKDDAERLAVELTDDDVMKLVLLELAAGEHPRPTTETLYSWELDECGRVMAVILGPRGVMEITCQSEKTKQSLHGDHIVGNRRLEGKDI